MTAKKFTAANFFSRRSRKSKPEAVACFGKEAKQLTHDAVEGKTIRLVLDKVNSKRRHKDRDGRTLAYAYLADGTMLNAELIRQGYAHAYTRFPFRILNNFESWSGRPEPTRSVCG